jgi:threonine/homoserine/homoserine lactone efflux protein
MDRQEDRNGWLARFLRELATMPRRHVIVFMLATILMLVLEIELTEGVHLVHVLEVLGGMVFLYLAWGAWLVRRRRTQ